MVFAGIKNETEAKALWAYLKQYDAAGKTKEPSHRQSVLRSSDARCPKWSLAHTTVAARTFADCDLLD